VDSILDSVKKNLDIQADYDAFDDQIMMHINSAFSTLNQLGIGPDEGFAIEDASATWDQFLGNDPRRNNVKMWVILKVKVIFDPPTGSYHLIGAMEQQIQELEWRISVKRENEEWTDPNPRKPADSVEPEVVIVPVSNAWYRE
jgi:hypothetical protein